MTVQASILFVHIGRTLPPWLAASLRQARMFNDCAIYLVAEREALATANIPTTLNIMTTPLEDIGISERHGRFRDASSLDKEFWDGFWTVTTERFFILDSAIAHLGLTNIVHLENDVLLYADLAELAPKLQSVYSSAAGTFISDELCVPGLMYLPNGEAATRLADALLSAVENADSIPLPQGLMQHCDMSLLAALRRENPDVLDYLPIVPTDYPSELHDGAGRSPMEPARYSQHFDILGTVFDGASLGQYLGGLHPRNAAGPTIGYVNPSCVFDPRLVRPRIGTDPAGRRIPQIVTGSGAHPVVNLHIHSKNPLPFLSL
jgi:hypothetical protein